MDAVLQTLAGSGAQLGVGGTLAFVIGLLVKLLIDERSGHDAELERKGSRLLAELKAKDDENARLRKLLDDAQVTIDIERQGRREAEDREAAALRGRRREGPRT